MHFCKDIADLGFGLAMVCEESLGPFTMSTEEPVDAAIDGQAVSFPFQEDRGAGCLEAP